jgi:1-deoxy-D-xylulose-5-phosphate reductoisomerase
MNKGLEVIEARWLFDVAPSRIKVLIHPEALVHALVEFNDGTVSAAMFAPDMRFPILRALSYPDIINSDLQRLDLVSSGCLTFSDPDRAKFPSIDIAYNALQEGGTCPAVLNGANEAAVSLFLNSKIGFTEIIPVVDKVIGSHDTVKDPDLEDIIKAESRAKEEVLSSC